MFIGGVYKKALFSKRVELQLIIYRQRVPESDFFEKLPSSMPVLDTANRISLTQARGVRRYLPLANPHPQPLSQQARGVGAAVKFWREAAS